MDDTLPAPPRTEGGAAPDDALLGFLRAELAVVQARLERADRRGTAIITAAVTAVGISVPALVSLRSRALVWVLAGVGLLLLLFSILVAIETGDDAEEHEWLGWQLNERIGFMRPSVRWLFVQRTRYRALPHFYTTDPQPARETMMVNLASRIEAGGRLAVWNEKCEQIAMLILFCGLLLLVIAVAIGILR